MFCRTRAEDVIHQTLRVADLLVSTPPAVLKARVAELLT